MLWVRACNEESGRVQVSEMTIVNCANRECRFFRPFWTEREGNCERGIARFDRDGKCIDFEPIERKGANDERRE